jgi:hypothetical protein
MKQLAALLTALAVALALALPARAADAEAAAGGARLSHDVYFTLKDNSADAKKKLVEACKKYLTGHDGATSFSAGVRAEELNGPVNDKDFDVALHIVFKDKASYDKYLKSEQHQKFLAENRDGWKQVRVFDAWVEEGKNGR